MRFGEKLAFLRKQCGMTQMELAEKLDISRQAVSRWERGTADPSTENLISIGRLFDVSVDDLVDENSYPQDLPTVQIAVEERKKELCHESKEDQVEPVSREEGERRRFSVPHVFAAVACILVVCITVCIVSFILFAERDQQELEDQVVPMEEMDQTLVELPEEAKIVIEYDRQKVQ